jgi:hypothetical protein
MKHFFITISLLIYCQSISYSQNRDTIFYKNGKISTGFFNLSVDYDFLSIKENYQQRVYPIDVRSLTLDSKIYLPVSVNILGEKAKVYFAEKLSSGEISILELNTTVKNVYLRKFFFYKDGYTTTISENNLDDFYKTYLKDCYKSLDNKNLVYSYNSIASVLENYAICKKINKNLLIPNRHIVQNYGIGIALGINWTQPKSLINYFGKNKIVKPKIYGIGQSIGISGQVKLKNNQIICLSTNSQKASLYPNDTVKWYDNTIYLTKGVYFKDNTFQNWNTILSFSQFFKVRQKLELGIGVGACFGRLKQKKYQAVTYEQLLNFTPKYENITLLDFTSSNYFLGVLGNLELNYTNSNIVYFIKTNYMYSIAKADYYPNEQSDYNASHIGLNLGLHYIFKR